MKTIHTLKSVLCIVAVAFATLACSAQRRISMANPQVEFDATEILYNQYPNLVPFYEEGVLKITSLVERNGVYDIKYKFVKYRYNDYGEMIACLKERFPELYELYTGGMIRVNSLYKYVDTDDMVIRYHVGYRMVYDYYYYSSGIYPYNGYRFIYRPRTYVRPPRVAPAPAPRPQPHHGGGPRPGGGHGHGGGPRPGGGPRR